ncbi:SDR family NAD(P)-dependent oxidoreductase [Halobacillus litoralis]|uniref:SDR family NAD(P)-dependent oxidoreductase n=1 Tax=Halobacillus litoralis TaxID=45668 RepID=UPI001CFECEAF|nr:SDR family oxidoreductase [Halobacillus litoralis]
MNILLTGATGFVGKQLTIRLLSEGHTVYALARNERKAQALEKAVPSEFQQQLIHIHGDISKKLVGVSSEDVERLTNQIDTVYHIAAYLSFDEQDREKTFEINVEGTKEVLELSKKIGTENFFHVSTAYTLGDAQYAEEELHPVDRSFVNSYEESKCHAEHLVFQYKEHFNINIYRPAIIVGDSRTGEADTTFALYGIIRSFQIMKKRMERKNLVDSPKVRFLCNEDTAQNFVPVDYVVDVLTAGLENGKPHTIYHITNSNPPINRKVYEILTSELDFHQVQLVPTDRKDELTEQELRFNEPMEVFHPYIDKTLTFDDSNTSQLLGDSNVKPLDMDEKVLRTIIAEKCR